MQIVRRSPPFSPVRRLIGRLPALLLALPTLAGIADAPLARSMEEPGRRSLSLEERVAAQKAIEEVFWHHRIWPLENPGPKPPLEKVLPDSAIRERVVDYLKKSNALEKLWGRPLTADQLQSELKRMAKGSRQPEVLREVFAALHDDPFLIAECLARPGLADRLLRNWYSFDDRVHGPVRAEARQALARLSARSREAPPGAEYHEITWRRSLPGSDSGDLADAVSEVSLPPGEYEDQVRRTRIEVGLGSAPADSGPPSRPPASTEGRFGPLQENEEYFFAKAILAQDSDSIRVGVLSWRKLSFEDWWGEKRRALAASVVPPEESSPLVTPDPPACSDDTWTPISFSPDARYAHTAVWTGSEMLVWGGNDANGVLWSSGFRYNPATDLWTQITPSLSPGGRTGHTAIWTGTRMIIWGGIISGTSYTNTGGRYDPATDTWNATFAGPGTPLPRSDHTAVWTGTEMIVWGGGTSGIRFNTGARYNPATNGWTATGTGTGVPAPRRLHSAVWTGSEMIVWGGVDVTPLDTGGRYAPSTNNWTATGMGTDVATPRFGHIALWTGSQMLIYGGSFPGSDPIAGSRYTPGNDSWSTMNTPLYAVSRHAAIWTGSEMIAWGGLVNFGPGPTDLGFRYDPASDSYVTTTMTGAPEARYQHSGVWTGTEMIVWGGIGTAALDTGGRYNPTSDSWVPTSRVGSPTPRSRHSEVWTGTEMIVWGGATNGPYPNTGGRYNPATDAWTATGGFPLSIPDGRTFHSTVWTGTEMIVWGGINSSGARLNSGGRYNPTADFWVPTGIGGSLPEARANHSAVWTGTEMIVWGGTNSTLASLNSGGRYNLTTDEWTPTGGGPNLPSGRSSHTATWTGDRMFIWGGAGSGSPSTTGGLYDPASNSWAAVSATDAPSSPDGHTAVWTGAEVIVWGSSGPSGNTGGRYNPFTNTWTATGTGSGVPSGRLNHTAVWANGEMIVWGGFLSPTATNTGGRYDPASDTWTPTGIGANAPTSRYDSRAVWTGSEMLVWGGFSPFSLSTGGRYCRQCATYYSYFRDRDMDTYGDPLATQTTCDSIPLPGFAAVSGDCVDTNATIYPGAPQICDGLNDDCLDASWPAVPANEANADGDGFRLCQGDCDDSQPTVYPGASQLCDGINNDCLDASWPTVPANEADPDGDGHRICYPDCSESDSAVWSPPSEVSGLAVGTGAPTVASWTSQSALAGPETSYDVVGGTLVTPAGTASLAAAYCLQPLSPSASFTDFRPAPDPGGTYWYLARAGNSCGIGTYGAGRDGAVPSCP